MLKKNTPLGLLLTIALLLVSGYNTIAQEKESTAVKSILAAPTNLLNSLKKQKPATRLTLSTAGETSYLGIGALLDSASGMTRSFALQELLLNRPIMKNGQPIPPVLVDYTFNAPYAVAGVVGSSNAVLRLYQKGKKLNEFILPANDWQSLWLQLNESLGGDRAVLKKKEKIEVEEGAPFKILRHTPITELMPGKEMEIKLLNSSVIPYSPYLKLGYLKRKEIEDPYEYLRELYGNYKSFDEKELYFFDGGDVPEDAKKAARPFALPLYRTPRPALQYLAVGTLLQEEKDWGGAFQTCLSTLASSDEIYVGPKEQALIREKAFLRMAELQKNISVNRTFTASLFLFAAQLNSNYALNPLSTKESEAYYLALDPLKDQLKKTLEMAYQIKGARFQGIVNAAGAFAGGLGASIGGASQAVSQPYINLMERTLKQTLSNNTAMQEKMNELFSGMDRNVNAKSFLAGQELEMDFGKPLVAAEVFFHLSRHPELVKEPIAAFAEDKPKLYKLLREYYIGKTPATAMQKIYEHLVFIEQAVLNYEGRNKTVPSTVLDKF